MVNFVGNLAQTQRQRAGRCFRLIQLWRRNVLKARYNPLPEFYARGYSANHMHHPLTYRTSLRSLSCTFPRRSSSPHIICLIVLIPPLFSIVPSFLFIPSFSLVCSSYRHTPHDHTSLRFFLFVIHFPNYANEHVSSSFGIYRLMTTD